MHLYHGSENIIERPVFGKGKRYNDYGLGFYCTESVEMAKEWGVADDRDGYANIYEFDNAGLSVLNLNKKSCIILQWLAILLDNRTFTTQSVLALDAKRYIRENFLLDYQNYDVIVGYRADDSYFSFAQDFLNGTISYRQLGNALRLGKLGEQVVLKSEKAFSSIRFIGAEEAPRDEWLSRKKNRDALALHAYFSGERLQRQKGDLYVTQILDEEMKVDDPRLQ
ncbi:MAG: DUF3990 domain-containing protein [Spirochaetales bacterium]|nr:DUF3990 domain-containing protein [Candidatus Physcosoma equi]